MASSAGISRRGVQPTSAAEGPETMKAAAALSSSSASLPDVYGRSSSTTALAARSTSIWRRFCSGTTRATRSIRTGASDSRCLIEHLA
ncbi:hypothetical protein [Arthrobacter sp. H16F315]|uniref:hypothetical protein n=1 Tax=Arthrobacter sp. H16F315 TaxID=2955314 RepID=UPI0021E637B4|nr:hypothetical protein [Arthrobacter sp. H16F315]MDD1477386.1 hypothetical protein [Arthrobacter sp. H16F315]